MMSKSAEEKFWEALKKLIERQEQTEKAIEKLRERQEKTDEQLRKTDDEVNKLRESQKKTDEQMRKTDKKLRDLMEAVRSVSDGYGRFVEGIVFPSVIKTFREMGYRILSAGIRHEVFDDNRKVAEVDNWIEAEFNGKKYLIIGEAKTRCSSDDVYRHIERMKKIRQIERYKNHRIIGFVSAINYEKDVDTYVLKNGLYLFRVSDDVMVLDVPKDFKPKEY